MGKGIGIFDIDGTEVCIGDTVRFEMPGFCSGDYVYKCVEGTMEENKRHKFEGAPERILDGCRWFKVIKRG